MERAVKNYAKYILFTVDKQKSLRYFKYLKNKYSVKYYKKQMHSIKKFLLHHGIEWANEISLPKDPINKIKRIDKTDVINTINLFEDSQYHLQLKALIMLGATSGLRAEEIYQLELKDIDLEKRIVYVNHNPKEKQSTKTGKSRISFFTTEAQEAIMSYLEYFNKTTSLKKIFSQTHITHLFRKSPIKVKDFRKYFSQQWDRRGGPTSIKKRILGHSIKNDIDSRFYNAQSQEDLKRIYDRVFNSHRILAETQQETKNSTTAV